MITIVTVAIVTVITRGLVGEVLVLKLGTPAAALATVAVAAVVAVVSSVTSATGACSTVSYGSFRPGAAENRRKNIN